MTSIFNALLIKLQERLLAAIPDSVGIPGIRMVDQDLGQLEFYTNRPPVAFPCILVDYTNTNYVQRQLKAQWAEMNIQLRLAFDPWSSSGSLAPQGVRTKALEYFEVENRIYLTLQDWTADGLLMLPLKRISAASERRDDQFRVRAIIFKATYEDRGMQAGGAAVPIINPAAFRIDWVADEAGQTTLQSNLLIGKTAAHILHLSLEGDDSFQIVTEEEPSAKKVELVPATGELVFSKPLNEGDHAYAVVLSN